MNIVLEGPDSLPLDWTPALKRIRLLLLKDLRDNFDGGHEPNGTPWRPLANARPRNKGKGTGKPLLDTGLLRASVTTTGAAGHVEDMGPLHLEAGTNLEYAWLQQAGGVIKPRAAKMLALPISRESVNYPSPRRFPRKLFVWKSKSNKAFLAENAGKRQTKLVLHYILLRSTTIPARPFIGFSPGFEERMNDVLADYVVEWLEGK